MHEADVARLLIDREACHQMPTGVPVVAFPALADLDGGLDLQASGLALLDNLGVDQVWVCLVGVVLERRVLVNRISEDVGDQTTEVIALDVCRQWLPAAGRQVCVNQRDNPLGLIHRALAFSTIVERQSSLGLLFE
jgi:hypothetical protein